MAEVSVTEAEVKYIAFLARLGLSADEIKRATRDLAAALANFSQIQQVDTRDVPTSDDVTGLTNVTRPDEVQSRALCSPSALLQAAPATHQNHLKVKAVFA
ncbi:MAG TPA: Asp-tRNA(Asn)/Glu-tRNA(Gln) amidotransferase subunit GatC [Candidatus Andersenbacteria bacterium]|nr:Asp-tRNA(Asn)/Glu-tRNA(Gln) amidotransferase subunit GatC [Candidatus Andersenbacteria bacterium]